MRLVMGVLLDLGASLLPASYLNMQSREALCNQDWFRV